MSSNFKRLLYVGLLVSIFSIVFSVVPNVQASSPADRVSEVTVIDDTDRISASSEYSYWLIELEDEPATRIYADSLARGESREVAVAATQDHISSLESIQRNVGRDLVQNYDVEILYALQRTANGIGVRVASADLQRISAMDGVAQLTPITLHTIDNSTSVPFIGADNVWEDLGLDGDGISIGIIDTGIDYLHLGFNGTADYANQTDVTITSDVAFPTGKVVGGYDWVGDDYDASGDDGSPIPVPDVDPTDCNGHGSHVGGTSASGGVWDDSGTPTAYTGPYDSSLYDGSIDWIVGPGVAPKADLHALKVFGCEGSTAVTAAAIEYSVDPNGDGDFSDHLDVINMSLGAGYGGTIDASVTASNNAALAGVIVVASAGNSGDVTFVTGSPGAATRVISTASTADSGVEALALDVASGAFQTPAVPAGFGPTITTTISGSLERPSGAVGCDATDFTGFTAGNVALIDRGACTFTDKVKNAQDAGAVAAVVSNVTTELPFSMGGTDGTITIPSVMIAGSQGNFLVDNALGQTATLDPSIVIPLTDTLSSFSSRGPARVEPGQEVNLKPDIGAPGSNITSVLTGYDDAANTGANPLTISGTSMAAPHMAGVTALVNQACPTFTPAEVKAAVMNTATVDIDTFVGIPDQIGTARIGAGRVVADAAVNCDTVLAYAAGGTGEVSVAGDIHVPAGTSGTESYNITLANKGNSSKTYNLSIDEVYGTPGVSVDASSSSVTVGAGKTATVTLNVSYDADLMAKACDDSLLPDPVDGRHCLSEHSGYVMMDGPTSIRLPFYFQTRVESNMQAADSTVYTLGGTDGSIALEGDELLLTGDEFFQDQISLVTAFELLGQDTNEAASAGMADNADLAHVGVATAPTIDGDGNDNYLYFAFNTYGEWSTPSEVGFEVHLDMDQNGSVDFILTNYTSGTDEFGAGWVDVNNAYGLGAEALLNVGDLVNVVDSGLDTRAFRNDVMFYGLDSYWVQDFYGADTAIDFWIETYSRDADGMVDRFPASGAISWDYQADPNVSTTNPGLFDLPVWFDQDGASVDFTSATGPVDVLLMHHHNETGNRAEIVTVDTTAYASVIGDGSFETAFPNDWTAFGDTSAFATGFATDGSQVALMQGGSATLDYVQQDIVTSGVFGETMILRYDVGSQSLVDGQNGARVELWNNGSKVQTANCLAGLSGSNGFATVECEFETAAAYDTVRVLMGQQNATSGQLAFDSVELYRIP